MRRSYLAIWIMIVIFAVLQTVGGAVYLALSIEKENAYTYVECTIENIVSEPSGESDETYIVKSVTVSYTNEKGEEILAELIDYPQSFTEGTTFTGRYLDDPLEISTESKDLSLQYFTLCLGVVYAIASVLLFVYRRKLGLYALEDVEGNMVIEDDDWTLVDNEESNEEELQGIEDQQSLSE